MPYGRDASTRGAPVEAPRDFFGINFWDQTSDQLRDKLQRNNEVNPSGLSTLTVAERPVPVSMPHPRWSRKALDCQPLGKVWVQMLITTKGDVCAASLFRPLPPSCDKVGADAIEAARKWKFRPARREGAPVAVLYFLGFDFKPEG
jgi:hypothetical protein